MSLRVTWPSIVGTSRESARSADDTVSALIMAFVAATAGEKMGAELRGVNGIPAMRAISSELNNEHDIDDSQIQLWSDTLEGKTIGTAQLPIITHAGGIDLDNYQLDTIKQLPLGGGVCALGCGLGKTATSLAAAYTVGCTRLYIVAPLNALGTWERHRSEMETYFNEVEIVSMDSLHKIAGLGYEPESVVIFDEVHLLGNISSQRTKRAINLRRQFDYGYALTGTLLHGGIEKALCVQNLASPGLSRFANRWKCGEHFNVIVRQQIGRRTITTLTSPTDKREDEWAEYLSYGTVVLNSQSESVVAAVDIPTQTKHSIECTTIHTKLTPDALVAEMVQQLELIHQEFPSMSKTMHFIARLGITEKTEWILGEMADNDLPIVIFCAYTETMSYIEQRLEQEGISYVKIDGSVTGGQRAALVDEFQTGQARVFLGQVEASCTSIELTRAHISICVDHSWKASTYDKALARTCRRGQLVHCHHFDLHSNAHQQHIIERLRKNASFDSKVALYQHAKAVRDALAPSNANP